MISDEQHELLKEIFSISERPDKMSLRLDPSSRSMVVEYEDLDDDWFKEMQALTPNTELTGARLRASGWTTG